LPKRIRRLVQSLNRADVQIQQSRQRQINIGDFIERDRFIDSAQRQQLGFGERQRSGRA